jgi:hypothetical protein
MIYVLKESGLRGASIQFSIEEEGYHALSSLQL